MIQCILHTFHGISWQQIRTIQNKEYARDRRRRHTNWLTKVNEETKQKVIPQLLATNIPKSDLHSVCEVSMSSIYFFYFFFFQIRDHINSFQAQESHNSRKDNGEKIFTGKWRPVDTENVSLVPTKTWTRSLEQTTKYFNVS